MKEFTVGDILYMSVKDDDYLKVRLVSINSHSPAYERCLVQVVSNGDFFLAGVHKLQKYIEFPSEDGKSMLVVSDGEVKVVHLEDEQESIVADASKKKEVLKLYYVQKHLELDDTIDITGKTQGEVGTIIKEWEKYAKEYDEGEIFTDIEEVAADE